MTAAVVDFGHYICYSLQFQFHFSLTYLVVAVQEAWRYLALFLSVLLFFALLPLVGISSIPNNPELFMEAAKMSPEPSVTF